jgi:hypothetical protein
MFQAMVGMAEGHDRARGEFAALLTLWSEMKERSSAEI